MHDETQTLRPYRYSGASIRHRSMWVSRWCELLECDAAGAEAHGAALLGILPRTWRRLVDGRNPISDRSWALLEALEAVRMLAGPGVALPADKGAARALAGR